MNKRRFLFLPVLFLLAGCQFPYDWEGQGMADTSSAGALSCHWYGLLLNPSIQPVKVPRYRSDLGTGEKTLRIQAKKWKKQQKKCVAALKESPSPGMEFYERIEEFIPTEELLSTRYELQAALAMETVPSVKKSLEYYSLATEHAFLTQSAIHRGNEVAEGKMSVNDALPAMKRLQQFRSELTALPTDDPAAQAQLEAETFDVVGTELQKAIGNADVILEFSRKPSMRKIEMTERGEKIETLLADSRWEDASRKVFPTSPRPDSLAWWTQFKLEEKLQEEIPEDETFSLIVWGAGMPFKMGLNDKKTVVVSGVPGGETIRIPVPPELLKKGQAFTLTLTIQGNYSSLPFRTAFLVRNQ